VAGGGSRGGLRLRRGSRNAGQRAAAQVSIDPREEFRTVGTCWGNTEGRFTGGWPWRARWTAGAAVAGARRKGGQP
jgi:hypothetical protein